MKSNKVCAIIVTYNGKKWIDQCLTSLKESSVHIDAYVVDNQSSDGTYEWLKNANCHYLYQSASNLGFGKANNIAIKAAYNDGYDYFLLLNQDAKIEPDVAKTLILSLQSNSDFGIASPMHFNWTGDELDTLFSNYLSRTDTYQSDLASNSVKKDKLYESPFINAACWMISRQTIELVGLFHPLFDHYGEDDNYLDRLFYHKLKLGLHPGVKMYHDRVASGTNPLKDDPTRLYKRTVLKNLLNPIEEVSGKVSKKKARKMAKRMSKELPGISKVTFRIKCHFEYGDLVRTVKKFKSTRQSELNVE